MRNLANEFHPVPKPNFRRKSRSKEFTPKTKQQVRERSEGMCEICHQRPGVHFHHVIYRSHIHGEAARDIGNCLHICVPCHRAVHKTRAMREYAVHVAKTLASGQPVEA